MNLSLHTWTWVAWLVGALIAISLTRNPLYLGLLVICLLIVLTAIQRSQQSRRFPFPVIRFGLVIILLSAIFNALTAHYGGTILFDIPQQIPILGGIFTLEGLVYGAINGLILFAILLAFMVLVSALPVRKLVRLIPRAFQNVAVVTSIAVTFIPGTIRQIQEIREAQLVRGHNMKGIRDWLPMMMPLLTGGLEHALQLSEAMTARGFASSSPAGQPGWIRALPLFGLGLVVIGWLVSLVDGMEVIGWGALLGGICVIVYYFWRQGQRSIHTNYLHEYWHWQDALIWICMLILIGVYLFPLNFLLHDSFLYPVYPDLSIPRFDPYIGAATLLIVLPALLMESDQYD